MLDANKSLIILNVTDKDQGVYSCRASNSNGKAVVKECNVSINGNDFFKDTLGFLDE